MIRHFRKLPLLALAIIFPAGAAGIDCGKSVKAAEHSICADPALRQADAAMSAHYATIRTALTSHSLKVLFAKSQRAWLATRDAGCSAAACLGPRIAARDTILAALAAQVSDPNPAIDNLHAVWVEGTWKIGPAEPKTLNSFANLPEEGETVTFRAGALCEGGGCADFGLSYQVVSDEKGEEELFKSLGLKPTSPIYPVLLNGKAEYRVVPMPDGSLLAFGDGCAKAGKPCGIVKQVWRPFGPNSRTREAELSEER